MKNNHKYKEGFVEWLEEGEQVSYSEFHEKQKIFSNFYIFIIISFLIIFLTLLLGKSSFTVPFVTLALMLFLNYLRVIIFKSQGVFRTFAITNNRLLLLDKYHRLSSIPYQEIFNLTQQQGKIFIIITPFTISSPIAIKSTLTPNFLGQKIINQWKHKSPYKIFNNRIQKFAEKYKLKFKPFSFKKRNNFSISGKIHDLQFSFSMKEMHNFNSITAKFTCSNEEKNYLLIYPENTSDSFTKLIGLKDYEIGIDSFDKKHILQGNNQNFIHYLLDEETAFSIHKITTQLEGKIKMGIKKEMEIQREIHLTNDNIALDAHLIRDRAKKISRTSNHTSELVYTSTHLKHYEDFGNLAETITESLETLILIAGRINAYDGK